MASSLYEPLPRGAAFSSAVNGFFCVWGGFTDNFSKRMNELASTIELFNPWMETWRQLRTEGTPPPGLYHGASAHLGHYFYTYGGTDRTFDTSSLHQLDTKSLRWMRLSAPSADGPMRKVGCGMIAYKNKLVVIGGYCVPTGYIQEGSEFIKAVHSTDGSGWTNEIHSFDLTAGTWSSPAISGIRPPPCAYFSLTMLDHYRAILFGGNQLGRTSNDLFILDLNTMHWTKVSQGRGRRPVGRSSHVAVCLDCGRENPQLVVFGGMDFSCKVLGDVWMLDIKSGQWEEVLVPNVLQSRCDHCASAFSLSSGVTEITIFGGCPEWPRNLRSHDDLPRLAETTVLRFEKLDTNEWILTDIANKTQLGTNERMREKIEKRNQVPHMEEPVVEEEKHESLEQMKIRLEAVEQSKHEVERRLEVAEERLKLSTGEVETRLREALLQRDRKLHEVDIIRQEVEIKLEESEEKARSAKATETILREEVRQRDCKIQEVEMGKEEVERRLEESEERARRCAREAETTLREAVAWRDTIIQDNERTRREFETRALEAEERSQELERRLEALEIEREVERRELVPEQGGGGEERQWLVRRREIHMTEEELGGGGWGEVKVAEFRGIRVAAKLLYKELQYDYYHTLFVREMSMASRVRHPNLVQFIGASMDEEMVILMELMPTSLRQHLTRNAPSTPFSAAVSLDVAKALNYLHLMQPHPIIHRDISSANVLLEPLPGWSWRAKVTDYGSVNLLTLVKSDNPGSPVYSAPEAKTPYLQSPKMDIFSFGVVLLEMCTAQFPEVSARERMIGRIQEQQWVDLIRRCIHHDRNQRPPASQIIAILKTWQV